MNKRLPAGFVRLSHLSQLEEKYSQKWAAQREALVASGYFTNAVIVIPRAEEPPDTAPYYQHRKVIMRQTTDRIRRALQGRGEFQIAYRDNGVVVITCRPQDVPLCTQALRE
jgi:cupin superfamily acireductone dioxygenase involved in methionine salvage